MFVLGMMVGGTLGMIITALLVAAKRSDGDDGC